MKVLQNLDFNKIKYDVKASQIFCKKTSEKFSKKLNTNYDLYESELNKKLDIITEDFNKKYFSLTSKHFVDEIIFFQLEKCRIK